MPKLAFYFIFLIGTFSFSQEYVTVDQTVRNYPNFKTLETLAIRIQNDFESNEEQVRAAFVWVTYNISYYHSKSEVFKPREKFIYYTDFGRKYQIRKDELNRINEALTKKRGVCIDYSLILNELCKLLGLRSKILSGVAKTTIEDLSTRQLYKNHTWNAVHVEGSWRLMDATWGAGFWDDQQNIFIKTFQEHYFFTKPSDFIKNHFPAKQKWQLSKELVTIEDFMVSPIYYPDYFLRKVELVSITREIKEVNKNQELHFSFNSLPKNYSLKYYIAGFQQPKKMRVKRLFANTYSTKLKLRKKLKSATYLTLLLENKPILSFKLQTNIN